MKKLVVQAKVVVAMPGLCDVTDFGLSDERKNAKKAIILLGKKKESLEETPTHDFFRTGDWESGGYLVLYNKEWKLISYLVKFEVHNGVMNFRRLVTQVAVWQSLTDPASKGRAEKVFFEILLPKYKAIMSDKLQTPRGRDFWIRNMALADSRGYQIAFVDQDKRTIEIYQKNTTINRWIQNMNTWGTHVKHEGEKFLIFKD
jgi:hypothetical protein